MTKTRVSLAQLAAATFILYLAVLGASLWLIHKALQWEVQSSTEAANSTFTLALVNSRWDVLRPMLGLDQGVIEGRGSPRLAAIDASIRSFARGTDLVKVKIYNAQGLTLYSSDPAQVGEDKSSNHGFKQALKGRVASESIYRGKFGAFDGDLYNRNLVSSYLPVRGPQGVEAVMEVYADRTESIYAVERQMYRLTAWIGGLLALGFAALFGLCVRRAPEPAVAPAHATESPGSDPDTRLQGQALCQLGEELARCSGELAAAAASLRPAGPDTDDRAVIERIVAISQHAALQADALMLYERVLKGDSVARSDRFDLRAMVKAIADHVEVAAKEKNLGAQVLVSSQIPEEAWGDPESLGTLLRTLTAMLVGRAHAGVIQFKAQTGSAGLEVDLISAQSSADQHRAMDLLRVSSLARALKAQLQLKSNGPDGDWFTVRVKTAQESV